MHKKINTKDKMIKIVGLCQLHLHLQHYVIKNHKNKFLIKERVF